MFPQRIIFEEFKKKALHDEEVKAEYDALSEEFELLEASLIKKRLLKLANKDK